MTIYTPQPYVLRPHRVEALRYTAANCAAVHFFVGLPHVRFDESSTDLCETGVFVATGDGVKVATLGDWVVRSEGGYYDVLTDAEFQQLYAPERRSRFGKRWLVSALAMRPNGRIIDRLVMSRHWTAGGARRATRKYRSFDDPNDLIEVVYQINHVDEVLS